MNEIWNLSKQINLNNWIYYFKGKTDPKTFISFKFPLVIYKNIKDGCTRLEKAEKKNEIVKRKWHHKSEEQKSAIKNIKTFYKLWEKVTKLFNDYSKIASKAICRSIHGAGLTVSTPKQMLQRLPIALAQVKAGNTSKNLLNEIPQIIYSLYQVKEIAKKVYGNIMNSTNLLNSIDTISMNSENKKTSNHRRLLLNI